MQAFCNLFAHGCHRSSCGPLCLMGSTKTSYNNKRAWMKYIIQGKRSWSSNQNGNLRSFSSSSPPRVGASLADGEKVVGIDLGTTFSLIAAIEGGRPVVIPSVEGHRMTPSVVAYKKLMHHDDGNVGKKQLHDDGSTTSIGEEKKKKDDHDGDGDGEFEFNHHLLLGLVAKRQAAINPENTFFGIKRFIGRTMDEVKDEISRVPFNVVPDEKGNVRFSVPALSKLLSAEEISAQILRKLVHDSSKYLNERVRKAVITVPAYFTDSQRRATKDAGRIAGLEVLRIINEPTAASLAYGLHRKKKDDEIILVYDLGGGTFDVSVLRVKGGVFEVLSTAGDMHLGGDDFDKCIVDWLAASFEEKEGIDIRNDKQALVRVLEAAEKAKIELSVLTQTTICLPFITTTTADGPKHIDTVLTRAKFEEICSHLLDRCRKPVEIAVQNAKLERNQIDEVILVGGSTRIPSIQQIVRRFTKREPNMMVNPDEVVALGAAVQAGVLAGEISDIVLLDVMPLSLGVETLGGVMEKIIPRNTTLPTKKSAVFSTAVDGQTTVEISIFEGEREFIKDNKRLASIRLDDIPSAPRGVPQIEVTFDIDANGILSVSAIDKETGKEQDITITGASTLPKDEVERMLQEAEIFSKEDHKRREAVDVKNQADSLIYRTEKLLREVTYVPTQVRNNMTEKLKDLKEKLEEGFTRHIRDSIVILEKQVIEFEDSIGGSKQRNSGHSEGDSLHSAG